jgi:hypothetical protein
MASRMPCPTPGPALSETAVAYLLQRVDSTCTGEFKKKVPDSGVSGIVALRTQMYPVDSCDQSACSIGNDGVSECSQFLMPSPDNRQFANQFAEYRRCFLWKGSSVPVQPRPFAVHMSRGALSSSARSLTKV